MNYNKPKLTKHEYLKNLTFSRDSDTWDHVTPVKPGYISESATGEMRPMTPEEKKRYSER